MVKYTITYDDSDLPVLGIVYSGDGLIVASSYSFISKRVVSGRLSKGISLAERRGKVLSRGRSSQLKEEASLMLSRLRRALEDELARLSLVDYLDQSYLTDFEKKVYLATLHVDLGKTATYGDIAREVGSSPRAVGQALARNPFSPVIPCHRVVRSDGSLGGFSGSKDVRDKAMMLQFESEVAEELKEKRFVDWRF